MESISDLYRYSFQAFRNHLIYKIRTAIHNCNKVISGSREPTRKSANFTLNDTVEECGGVKVKIPTGAFRMENAPGNTSSISKGRTTRKEMNDGRRFDKKKSEN